MKNIDKYLQQIRLYRMEQQINKSTFEMALYFDLFEINENEIGNVYNTTLDNKEFTQKEKNKIFVESKKVRRGL